MSASPYSRSWYAFVRNRYILLAAAILIGYVLFGIVLATTLRAQGSTLQILALNAIPDSKEYNQLAHALLGGAFTLDGVHPEFFRTPGYPAFVALCYGVFHSTLALIGIQILLVALSCVLIARIGERLFSLRIGVAAAILYAIDPATAVSAFTVMSDNVFVFLLLLSVWILLRSTAYQTRDAFLFGLLGGAFTLVRQVGEFLLPLLLLWFIWERVSGVWSWKEISKWVAAACVGATLFIVPWMVRNDLQSGHFALSTLAPYNLLFYNLVYWEVAHGANEDDTKTAFANAVGGHWLDMRLRDFTYTDAVTRESIHVLSGNLVSYVLFHLEKTAVFYVSSSVSYAASVLYRQPPADISMVLLRGHIGEAFNDLVHNSWQFAETLLRLAFLALAVFALFGTRGEVRRALLFFAALVLLTSILTGPVSSPRYRLPAEPFLALAGCVGAAKLLSLRRHSIPTSSGSTTQAM